MEQQGRGIIPRVGGKNRLKSLIVSLFPEHELYVEPFIGGGSVFMEQESHKNVINDKDKDIYHLWADLKAVPLKTIMGFDFTHPTRKDFLNFKNQTTFSSRAERLYRNLYLSFYSYRANRRSYGLNKSGRTNRVFFMRDIGPLKKKLRRTIIHNKDYLWVLDKYDAPTTLFYLDPPYYDVSKQLYEHEEIDYEAMRDALDGLKGKFIMSLNDTPYTRSVFKDFNVHVVDSYNTLIRNNKQNKELVITNFKVD